LCDFTCSAHMPMDNAALNSQYIGEFQREAACSADVTGKFSLFF